MNSQASSESGEAVSRAIETYDHLLWEAVIKVCGTALSRSFKQEGNRVRVVYQTFEFEPGAEWSEDCPVDPRQTINKIRDEVDRLISLALPIRKLGRTECDEHGAFLKCSNNSYFSFFTHTVMYRGEKSCDFVKIGHGGQDGYICCPCVGEHLGNTKDLLGFNVNLQPPKRVGRDTYEFRFEVAATT